MSVCMCVCEKNLKMFIIGFFCVYISFRMFYIL